MRLVCVVFILVTVLMVGLPFGPTDDAYFLTRRFGLDVSMAPITVDTSMMTDEKGNPSYEKKTELVLRTEDSEEIVSGYKLDFYLHKIPLHHYYEIISYGQEMDEGKYFLCRSFSELLQEKVLSFMIRTEDTQDKEMGFNEPQICP